jgi:uncharacterized protein (DUF362 family)/Pyruvate/2-oxoacid:ferredoxin oxidoreductase delta subunit
VDPPIADRDEKDAGSSLVAAVRCSDYEFDRVRAALEELLAPLGGMAAFVNPGERIALKPNLLMPAQPEQGITTHPVLTTAVALAVKEAGAHPVVVESPGTSTVHVKPVMERVFRRTGYAEMAERYGFEVSLDMGYEAVPFPEAALAKRMEVMTPILEADGVINLAKLKTHMFMIFTGAVKNLFGVIPGLNKASQHARLADPRRFADMLVDLACFVRPRLSIVDGVIALEGNGPGTGGQPRSLGILLAGADPVTVDVACCRMVDISTASVPVLVAARERGLWDGREAGVDTVGVPISELRVGDFAKPDSYEGIGVGRAGALDGPARLILRRFNRVPRPRVGRCTVCGDCERACPVGAITVDREARVAKVDDSPCIRCYCCHEVCPSAAIDLEFTGLGRVMQLLRLLCRLFPRIVAPAGRRRDSTGARRGPREGGLSPARSGWWRSIWTE